VSEEAPLVDAPEGAPIEDAAPDAPDNNGYRMPAEAYEAELRRARDEAAEFRVKMREIEERYASPFSDLDEDEAEYIRNLGKTLSSDPRTAAKQLQTIIDNINDKLGPDEPQFLTREDLQRIEDEKAQEAAVQEILREAQTLGYQENTAEMSTLLWMAAKDPSAEGSIAKAHEILTGKLGSVIEEAKKAAVAEYLETVKNNNAAFPPIGSDNPGNPSDPPREAWKSDKDTRKSALARLDALLGGQPTS
jgi:hypothetical protein